VDLALTVALVKPDNGLAILKNLSRTAFGGVALATAAIAIGFASAENPPLLNGAGIAQDIVKPLPLWQSWMMVGPVRQAIWEATDGFDPAAVKLVADLGCNVAFAFLHHEA
jgi:hypothetical protein